MKTYIISSKHEQFPMCVCETNHISHTGVVIDDSEVVVNIQSVWQSQF